MAIPGLIIVLVSVIGGFIIAKGDPLLLLQPAEFIVILGAAIGSMVVMNDKHELKEIIHGFMKALKPSKGQKETNLGLLRTLYDLFLIAQRDGIIALERHIEKPDQSEVLNQSPFFTKTTFIRTFLCDTLKMVLAGVNATEIEQILDRDIETYEAERKHIAGKMGTMAESFPGLGIVAAVLGVILTMKSIDQGAAAVGEHIAAALVGTFLGILFCYGIFGPIAQLMEKDVEVEITRIYAVKSCIIAFSSGLSPIVSVELSRRSFFESDRPSFTELESYLRGK